MSKFINDRERAEYLFKMTERDDDDFPLLSVVARLLRSHMRLNRRAQRAESSVNTLRALLREEIKKHEETKAKAEGWRKLQSELAHAVRKRFGTWLTKRLFRDVVWWT